MACLASLEAGGADMCERSHPSGGLRLFPGRQLGRFTGSDAFPLVSLSDLMRQAGALHLAESHRPHALHLELLRNRC